MVFPKMFNYTFELLDSLDDEASCFLAEGLDGVPSKFEFTFDGREGKEASGVICEFDFELETKPSTWTSF